MASRGMFATTDLIEPLAQRGHPTCPPARSTGWSPSGPERLSLKMLMALLDILDCSMEDLIEPAAAGQAGRKARAAGGAEAGVGELRPKRARITRAGD